MEHITNLTTQYQLNLKVYGKYDIISLSYNDKPYITISALYFNLYKERENEY